MTTAPATGACAASPLHPIARPIAFDRITADAVEPAIEAHLADARSRLQAIAAETAPPTYANTLGALDAATAGLGDAMAIVGHLEAVVSTPELRAAYNRVQPRVSELYARIPLDAGLWQRLQAFAATEEAAGLTGAEARFLSLTLADFRRHGAELDMAGKERLAALDVELSALCTRFAQQLLDATQAFGLQLEDSRRLAGLPPAALALARQKAA
ncbi:MAG: M3 family peptidase, partial [Polyangiales bacterium]